MHEGSGRRPGQGRRVIPSRPQRELGAFLFLRGRGVGRVLGLGSAKLCHLDHVCVGAGLGRVFTRPPAFESKCGVASDQDRPSRAPAFSGPRARLFVALLHPPSRRRQGRVFVRRPEGRSVRATVPMSREPGAGANVQHAAAHEAALRHATSPGRSVVPKRAQDAR